jgi:dipeptidyl aminopeptidase/acylaminoacyl peptidase
MLRRLSTSFIALTVAGASFGASFPAAAQAPKVLAPQDLFGLSRASDPRFRPDGGAIAYVRITNDIMVDKGLRSIWLIDTRTGAQSPLAAGEGEAYAPRWSPDGSRIAYLASKGDAPPDLMVKWLASGQTARIATLERPAQDVAWSPDGKELAFVMLKPEPDKTFGAPLTKPEGAHWSGPLKVITALAYRADGKGDLENGRTHVFVAPADGGAPRQITFGDFDDAGPLTWSPDGGHIVFTGRRGPDWERNPFRSEVYSVAVAGSEPKALTSQEGPDGQADISPDGRQIAYVGYDDHYRGYTTQHIYVAGIDGTNRRVLAPDLDRTLAHPHWAPDGKAVYAEYVDHGVTKVARLTLDGRMAIAADGLGGGGLDLPYSGGEWSVGPGGAVAFTLGAPDRPPEIALASEGRVRRLTSLNEGLLGVRSLAHLEHLDVKSSYDGLPVDAWMLTPPGFDASRKYPLALEIHGGPFASYGPTFATDDQLYAAAGYVVVYANPRGSTSYGDKFANEIDHAYPGHDYDDLMSTVDAAVAKGFVDPGRLFVTGGSGGGVLTSWIVGKTHRFRAAVAQKPVINWSSEVLTDDLYAWMGKYWFGNLPWEDPQGYWARSPLSLVGNVETPTMVIVGDKDVRTPDEESEQYYAALRLRGIPTALIKTPGAFHDMAARPSHAAAKAAAVLAWFALYDTPASKP